MLEVHMLLIIPGFLLHIICTVTHTTIVPCYQLTAEDVASLNFQTHGELNPRVLKPPNEMHMHQPHSSLPEFPTHGELIKALCTQTRCRYMTPALIGLTHGSLTLVVTLHLDIYFRAFLLRGP